MPYRPYTSADLDSCVFIFDSNCPRFFASADRREFLAFLKAPPGFFGILAEDSAALIGCGGLALSKTRPDMAFLTWGMIHAHYHGRGWGRLLAMVRLYRLLDLPAVERVALNTSNEAVDFYRKLGFGEVAFTPHGYREGLDRYDLELIVDADFRCWLADWGQANREQQLLRVFWKSSPVGNSVPLAPGGKTGNDDIISLGGSS
jgi:ribosomal protein S18 acetylase RimI-like enzyme